jgi:hypothetical protein
MTKRNFILVKADAPRSVKLFPSSAVSDSGLVLDDALALALDDWDKINECLLAR